ncbi:DAPG hydrolase family protein [Klebsiella sp. WOUb02]|uniref:DAPG hydrolase family protein n=1 Tax=Klebsiella sp. WOUb02 TaxID=3161071 RepID=UPI003CF273C0
MKSTHVTYFPPKQQKQFDINYQSIKDTSYAAFFKSELNLPDELLKLINNGPVKIEQTFSPTIDNINTLYENLDDFPYAVYGAVDDGQEGLVTFNLHRHYMEGVSVEMMQWWFTWHVQSKERYSLWFPHAHIDNSVKYPERLNDNNLSYAEKMYGNPNRIKEYIGGIYLDGVIHFMDPVDIGLSPTILEKNNLKFSASGWSHPFDHPDSASTLMLHIGRDVENGFELFTCYFIGGHKEFSRISKIPGSGENALLGLINSGVNKDTIIDMSYEMAMHDLTEFTNLASILPELYSKFGRGS